KSTLIAADILDRLGLPWTLFVVVDTLLDGYQPSFARVVEAASATGTVVRAGGTEFDLSTNAGKYLFDRRAKSIFANAASEDRDTLTSELLASPGVEEPSRAAFPFMTLEEVKELHGRGVEIGNHSARHANLTRCTEAELELEVSDSRLRLERALGAPVRFFSYPDGRHNRAVRKEVAGSHDVAVATWKALRPYAPLSLRRIQAPPTSKELPRVLVPTSPRRFWWERQKWDLRRRKTELRSRYQRSS
ncbi:MAG: hypothetical protein QOK47_1381, partial [Actinomycetota bacterium]|nr:hypothetical protein [Actinomycetota bacterium]